MTYEGYWTINTAPSAEPVTKTEAKLWVRQDDDADDDIITDLIVLGRELAEEYTGRAFITQTWELHLNGPPIGTNIRDNIVSQWPALVPNGNANRIMLPRPPLASVTTVEYYTTSGDDWETYSSDNYTVVTADTPGFLFLNQGCTWPTSLRSADCIKITYVAGYGNAGTDCPARVRTAIKQFVMAHYDDRGNYITGSMLTELPNDAKSTLASLRVI